MTADDIDLLLRVAGVTVLVIQVVALHDIIKMLRALVCELQTERWDKANRPAQPWTRRATDKPTASEAQN